MRKAEAGSATPGKFIVSRYFSKEGCVNVRIEKSQEGVLRAVLPASDHPSREWMIEALGRVLRDTADLLDRLPALAPHWPEDPASGHVDEAIEESALLLLAAARVPADGLRSDVTALTASLIPHVHSARSAAALMRSRRNRQAILLPHLVLSKLGYRDPVLDELLRDGAGAAEGEVQGLQLARREWLRGLDKGSAPDLRRLNGDSIFSQRLNLLEMDPGDLHAAAHWVAYATDLGQVSAPGEMVDAVVALLDDAIAWQIGAENLDLVAELLMMARMMRLPQSPGTNAAWALIQAAGDASYRTMHVLGLLCATELRFPSRHTTPAVVDPGYALDVAMAAEVAVERSASYRQSEATPVVAGTDRPDEARSPFWRTLLESNPHHGGIAVAADLILAVRGYDLAAVARAMDRWMEKGLPASGLFLDAVAFLTRQQVADGAIGAQFLIDENRTNPAAATVTSSLAELLARAAVHICEQLAADAVLPIYARVH